MRHEAAFGAWKATPSELFGLGWDTAKIALYWNMSEAQIERAITIERCRLRGLPSPYEHPSEAA